MKLSINWLKDYIQADLPIEELAEMLTDIGLEVEGEEQIQSIKGGLQDLVVGHVLSKEKHENADRLNVCQVDLGDGQPVQIVCGAPNVDAGQKVIVAPVGSLIHPIEGEPFSIKKAKIRGVESFGMICAEDEIGLGKSHDGIKVLPEETKTGMLVADLYEVETDTVLEIGLTPNRSDANSHLGTARDLASAILIQKGEDQSVNWPSVESFAIDNTTHTIDVVIENEDACPRYAGVVVSGLEIKPSPTWMQNRLKSVGVKPINNIVDITNFINHEYGQPLHAFDLSKIEGNKIIVRNLPEGTSFVTLDGVERKLSSEDLMICNASKGMCIAGVYGGLDSGISENTTSIFLESAYFDPKTIRRTELRHNLRTDAAAKFEKGIDPTKQVEVLKRAALLMKELAGGEISSELIDLHPKPIEQAKVVMSFKRLNQLTGVDFTQEQAIQILESLEFTIESKDDEKVELLVPQYRADVLREADVIEEVLRIYGFNNVPMSGQANFALSYGSNAVDALRNQLANHLSAKGMNEIMTNSITRSSYYSTVEGINQEQFIRPLNSLNSHLDIMRPDMLMTGLESIAYNQNHQQPNCAFYEFGKSYAKYGEKFEEKAHLAIYVSGKLNGESWLSDRKAASFYDLKKMVEEVLKKVGIVTYNSVATSHPFLAEGLEYKNKQYGKIVEFGLVKPEMRKILDVKNDVLFADINFDVLQRANEKKTIQYQPVSKFPKVQRDLALVIDKEVTYQQIEEITKQKGGKYLTAVNLFNVFADEEKLGQGKKSYAVSFTFANKEETLTSKQIDKQMNKLMEAFTNQLGAIIRM